MLNDQLLSYIRGEVSKGLTRGAISKALIDAGWPAQDVHEAMVALAVPKDMPQNEGAIPATSNSVPSAPQSIQSLPIPTTPTMDQPLTPESSAPQNEVPKPAAPLGTPAMVPNSYGDHEGKLPGVFALVKNGMAIYRRQLKTLLTIAGIEAVFVVLSLTSFYWVSAHGQAMLAANSGTTVIALGIIGAIALLVFMLAMTWCSLALLHAIRGSEEQLSAGKSFGRARSQLWGFIVVSASIVCVILGMLVLYVALPALVLGEVSTLTRPYLNHGTDLLIVAVAVCAVFAAIVTVIRYAVRYLFATWVLVNGEGKGVGALAQSSLLMQGRWSAVFWRFVGMLFLLGAARWFVSFVLSLFFGNFMGKVENSQNAIGFGIYNVIVILVLAPIFTAALYTLYASVRASAGILPIPDGMTKKLKIMAVVGVVGIFAIPALLLVLAAAHVVPHVPALPTHELPPLPNV